MRILVTGASGLVGSAFSEHATRAGHTVEGLSRHTADGRTTYEIPEGADALVHLAGESIAEGSWSAAKKQRIRDSRVDLTTHIVEQLGAMAHPPRTLVCASAIGFYGDRGDAVLTEDSAPGEGFLAETTRAWEAAAVAAEAHGIRVVRLRIGIVLSPDGGALKKMLTPFRLGVGGVLGPGTQWMSWIHLTDLARLIAFAIETETVQGVLNATAPGAVRNASFTKTLGSVLHRPTILPAPAFALRLAFGEMADALLLASTHVVPERTTAAGFGFRFEGLEPALQDLLG